MFNEFIKIIENCSSERREKLLSILGEKKVVIPADTLYTMNIQNMCLEMNQPTNLLSVYRLCRGLDVKDLSERIRVNILEIYFLESVDPLTLRYFVGFKDLETIFNFYGIDYSLAVDYVNESSEIINPSNVQEEFIVKIPKVAFDEIKECVEASEFYRGLLNEDLVAECISEEGYEKLLEYVGRPIFILEKCDAF